MKKYIIVLSLLCSCLAATAQTGNFKITGKRDSGDRIKKLFLKVLATGMERIPVTFDEQGNFLIEGTVTGVVPAEFQNEDESEFTTFLLEATEYRIELNMNSLMLSKIEGGKQQSIFLEVNKMKTQMKNRHNALEDKLMPLFLERYEKGEENLTAEDKQVMDSVINEFKVFDKAEYQKFLDFYQANNDSDAVLFIIYNDCYDETIPLEFVESGYALLSDRLKNNPTGVALQQQIEKLGKISIGKVAPDFVLTDLSGKEVSLYGIKAKLKIIDFWASWCGPCRKENPNMKAIYEAYKDKGLEIVSVSLDKSKMVWEKAIAEDALTWTQLCTFGGFESPAIASYNVTAIPCTFILDENNVIVATKLRGEELAAKIKELLDK